MQQTSRNLWIPLLVAFIIGCGLLGSMFFPPYMIWGAIIMLMVGAMSFGHPRQVLFLFWVWACLRPLVKQMADNFLVSGSNGLIVAVVVLICLGIYVRRRSNTGKIAGIFKIFAALLGVALASFFMNGGSVFNITWFFINYLAFPFVFYAAYTTLDRRHWRYLFGGIIGLMLIQFALNIGWRLGVNPLPNIWSGTSNIYDMAQGTFGTCAHVAYYMIPMFFLLFSALRLRTKYKMRIYLLIGLALIQFYITYTNHAYIYFIVLFPIYLVVSKQSLRVRMACVAMVILGAMAFSFLASRDRSTEMGGSVDVQFTSDNLQDRWDRFIHGPKIELINRIAVQNATRDPYLWLLGNGPGKGLSAVGMIHDNAFAWKYLGEYVANTGIYRANQMTSVSGNFYSGVLSIWSELGALGYLLYVSLYIYAVQWVLLRLLRNQYVDPFQRVLAEGFVMAMLTFLLASFLQDIFWVLYFPVGLWIWAAMVWDPVEEEEDGDQSSEGSGQTSEVEV